MADIAPHLDRSKALRGAAALLFMFELIGGADHNDGDHQVAKLLCDNELELRALYKIALAKLAAEL